jgi:hypothetical protein
VVRLISLIALVATLCLLLHACVLGPFYTITEKASVDRCLAARTRAPKVKTKSMLFIIAQWIWTLQAGRIDFSHMSVARVPSEQSPDLNPIGEPAPREV